MTTSKRNASHPHCVSPFTGLQLGIGGLWPELTPTQAHKAESSYMQRMRPWLQITQSCSVFYLLHFSCLAQASIPQDMHSAVAKMLIAH